MIEAVAIIDRPPEAATAPAGLAVRSHGAIAGVFRAVAERPEPAGAEDLWRYDRVIEELMADHAVLPLRYGTVLEDEGQLERALAERAEQFERLLDSVRGRVELALRVLGDEDDEPGPTLGGGEYMRALARRKSRSDRAAALLAPLDEIADAAVARDSAAEAWTRRAYLVRRDRVEEFNSRLDEVRRSSPGLRVTCTGPWPPYSFVSEAE